MTALGQEKDPAKFNDRMSVTQDNQQATPREANKDQREHNSSCGKVYCLVKGRNWICQRGASQFQRTKVGTSHWIQTNGQITSIK